MVEREWKFKYQILGESKKQEKNIFDCLGEEELLCQLAEEAGELEVIYKAFNDPELTWCRSLDVFLSEVDKEKYPDAKQEMRFERVGDE